MGLRQLMFEQITGGQGARGRAFQVVGTASAKF